MSRLDTNLAVFAGAGTGKTHALMTMCLHLLAGARRDAPGQPLAPARLTLVTFSEKAAAELRQRLRKRLDGLAEGTADEPELWQSFEELGCKPPSVAHWRAVRSQLGTATVSTFHALCLKLLKRAPAGHGVSPGIEVLDERQARELLRSTIEKWVISRLEAQESWLADWVEGSEYHQVLKDLGDVLRHVREDGVDLRQLKLGDASAARRDFEAAVVAARAWLEEAKGGLKPAKGKSAGTQQFDGDYAEALRVLDGATAENFLERAEPLVHRFFGPLAKVRNQLEGVGARAATVFTAPFEQHVRQALVEISADYATAMQQRQAIDFTQIMLQCRDVLREVPAFCRQARAEIGALLVDEFQDTNAVQLDIVRQLAAPRDGSARAFESASLAVVGDRKQAIYDFRGADVSVFSALAADILADGGGRRDLQTSRRASPGLIEVFNRAFPALLAVPDEPRPYEIAYESEHDDLAAHRPPGVSGAPLTWLRSATVETPGVPMDESLFAEADGIARYLRQLFDDGVARVDDGGPSGPRPARPGDVAMLFKRTKQVEVFRQALERHGIRHWVVRGKGFFAAQEVVDAVCWLRLLSDPGDGVALATMLRSPWVGLSDTSMLRLAEVCEGKLDTGRLLAALEAGQPEGVPAAEAQRLSHWAQVYLRYRAHPARLGLHALLKGPLTELGVTTALAASPYGEQALLNIETVLSLARSADESGRMGLAELADELQRASEGSTENPRDDSVQVSSPDAVLLMTAHQAKGLEWPIVVLPDLGAWPVHPGGRVIVDRTTGLALKPWTREWEGLTSTRYQEVNSERARRDVAQRQRLLYVAMTRARDLLVLGPVATKPRSGTWASALKAAMPVDDFEGKIDCVQVDGLETERKPQASVELPADADAQVEAVIARALGSRPPRFESAMLSVTQLGDFALCQRRYYLTHVVGLREGREGAVRGAEGQAAPSVLEARSQGIDAHRVLERVDWAPIAAGRIKEAVQAAASECAVPADAPLLPWVERFLGTSLGQELAQRGDAYVHREQPFVVTLRREAKDFGLYLRGQLDVFLERADGSALVLDYKTTLQPTDGTLSHAFQLDCYGLAARQLVTEGTPVTVALAFLQEPKPTPVVHRPSGEDFSSKLIDLAQSLLAAQASGQWDDRQRPQCEAMNCPHILRCHGPKTRL